MTHVFTRRRPAAAALAIALALPLLAACASSDSPVTPASTASSPATPVAPATPAESPSSPPAESSSEAPPSSKPAKVEASGDEADKKYCAELDDFQKKLPTVNGSATSEQIQKVGDAFKEMGAQAPDDLKKAWNSVGDSYIKAKNMTKAERKKLGPVVAAAGQKIDDDSLKRCGARLK